MADVISMESLKSRREKRRKRRARVFRVILLTLLIAAVAVLYINRDTFQNFEVDAFVHDSGDTAVSFPVKLPGSNTYELYRCGSRLVLLTDTHFYLYSGEGELLTSFQHGLAEPCVAVGSTRCGLYERGGHEIRVLVLSTLKTETFTSESPICDAAFSDDAKLCVVEDSTRYVSEMLVYDSHFEELYRWSTQQLITACAFADNQTVAAVSLGASGGEMESQLYVINVSREEFTATLAYYDNMLLSLDCKSGGVIVAIGDKGAVAVNTAGKQLASYSYGGQTITACDNTGDLVLLVLGDYTTFKTNESVVLDANLNELARYASEERVLSQTSDDRRAALLFDDHVMLYENGEFTRVDCGYGFMRAMLLGGRLVLESSTELTVVR